MANGLNRPMMGGRRGNAQLPLAIVAVLAIVLVLLGKAQSSLFDQARASFTDWTRPTLEWVSAPFAGAANWVGNLGSVFSPTFIGWVNDRTHSTQLAINAVAGMMVLAGLLIVLFWPGEKTVKS